MRVDFRGSCCLILFSVVLISTESQALVITSFLEERHDRFYQPDPGEPAKDFIGDDLSIFPEVIDLSGVAGVYIPATQEPTPENEKYETWVTMISETHYLAATHARRTYQAPISHDTLTFYRDNDLNGQSWTLTPELNGNGEPINIAEEVYVDDDFYIGKLKEAPPSWVKRYPLLKRPAKFNPNAFNEIASNNLVAEVGKGHHPDLPVASQFNIVRVGLKEVVGFSESGVFTTRNLTDTTLQGDTSFTRGGDSGAPEFIVLEGIGAAVIGNHTNGKLRIEPFLDTVIQIITEAGESVTVVTDLRGDLNADLKVDLLDIDILGQHFGAGQGYSQGDINGDGSIDLLDLDILSTNFGKDFSTSPADFNGDDSVDHLDFQILASNWGQSTSHGDANNDGTVDISDAQIFDDYWLKPRGLQLEYPYSLRSDFNEDGIVDLLDLDIISTNFGAEDVEPFTNGNANDDRVVDLLDLDIYGLEQGPVMDANDDGLVDVNDVAFITDSSRWGLATADGRDGGDLNLDGIVNETDLGLLSTWWRYGYSEFDRGQGALAPEPSALMLFSLGMGIYCSGYRKRIN